MIYLSQIYTIKYLIHIQIDVYFPMSIFIYINLWAFWAPLFSHNLCTQTIHTPEFISVNCHVPIIPKKLWNTTEDFWPSFLSYIQEKMCYHPNASLLEKGINWQTEQQKHESPSLVSYCSVAPVIIVTEANLMVLCSTNIIFGVAPPVCYHSPIPHSLHLATKLCFNLHGSFVVIVKYCICYTGITCPGAERITANFLTLRLQISKIWTIMPIPIVYGVDCWLVARYLSSIFSQPIVRKVWTGGKTRRWICGHISGRNAHPCELVTPIIGLLLVRIKDVTRLCVYTELLLDYLGLGGENQHSGEW